ncbi:MAG: hypothetical protein ACRD09_01120 [Vicinamibacterales bacterium]
MDACDQIGGHMERTRGGTQAAGIVLLIAAALLTGEDAAGAKTAKMSWYADTRDPPARNHPLPLGDGSRTVRLAAGWSCVIWPLKKTSAFEGRTTSCRKGTEIFEFSVQCDAGRPKDHAQIRFRDDAGVIDFIEVGCRPTSNRRRNARAGGATP